MLVRKVRATNELFHAIRGTIDTREKFLAKRLDLAGKVWKSMQDTDSRECRNCHGYRYMDARKQGAGARAQHRRGREKGKTCIDCHMGIAHRLPEEFVASEHERYERENVPCADCHTGMAGAPFGEDWSVQGEDVKNSVSVRSE